MKKFIEEAAKVAADAGLLGKPQRLRIRPAQFRWRDHPGPTGPKVAIQLDAETVAELQKLEDEMGS